METEQITYNFHMDSDFYRYRLRSCTNCEKQDRCDALKKDWSAQWLDMGRCGCGTYAGPYEEEKPMFKDFRGRTRK